MATMHCHSVFISLLPPLEALLHSTHLCVVLLNQRLAQLDVFIIRLLLARPGIHNLLPLVVLGLALFFVSPIHPHISRPSNPKVSTLHHIPNTARISPSPGGKTYGQVKHARLLRRAEIRALRDFGVRVELTRPYG
jgi:hypothetical protein